jgi:Cft2 family RNA processing exonuclease
LLILDELSNSQGKETPVDIHGMLEILNDTVTHSHIESLQHKTEKRA